MNCKYINHISLRKCVSILCAIVSWATCGVANADPKSEKTSGSSAGIPVEWKRIPGESVRFSLEYENSQHIETLDANDKPVGQAPELASPRRVAMDIQLTWRRQSGAVSIGTLKVLRIRGITLPSWSQRQSIEPDLAWEIRARSGKKRRLQVKNDGSARSLLRALAGSRAAADEFHAALTEALSELLALFPSGTQTVSKPGDKWRRKLPFQLERNITLDSEFELELLETRKPRTTDSGATGKSRKKEGNSQDPTPADKDPAAKDNEKPDATRSKTAVIEGGIRQRLRGAPKEAQRQPGLFPGSVQWIHDLDRGFPRQLEAKKVARIPIPDDKLPTIKTLTHRYELKVQMTGS